ncbi:MAG TPA: hypothetical protein VLE95_00140, partial [Chlamydiales bacterium]|nr:hypothetical protein [Chlamydiales bacterium]
ESAASALQHLFCLRSRLAIRQWSLAPEQKICAASLHISANLILNHYIRIFPLHLRIYSFKPSLYNTKKLCSSCLIIDLSHVTDRRLSNLRNSPSNSI